MIRNSTLCAAIAALLSAGAVHAQSHEHQHQHNHVHPAAATASSATASSAEGEIRKIDKENGKVTIKHGPLANLKMPAMTMAFKVQDPAMLEKVKVGDKVNFAVDRIDGAFTVTQLQIQD